MLDHLIINLDPEGDASLQAQLRQSVVEAILSRAILPGDKLPSSRALAYQLGISRNTVVLAYQALIDTGFIEAHMDGGGGASDGEDAEARRAALMLAAIAAYRRDKERASRAASVAGAGGAEPWKEFGRRAQMRGNLR